MKKTITHKKIVAYALGILSVFTVFGGYFQPTIVQAQWVDNCDRFTNPNPGPSDTGYTWVYQGSGGANTIDSDGSCSWIGGTCDAGNAGNIGRFEDTTMGPGSTANWTEYMCNIIVTPGPSVTINANPGTIDQGNATLVTWNSVNATSCSAPWTSSTATSGTEYVAPALGSTSLSITCVGPTGSTTVSDPITVVPTWISPGSPRVGDPVCSNQTANFTVPPTFSGAPGLVNMSWQTTSPAAGVFCDIWIFGPGYAYTGGVPIQSARYENVSNPGSRGVNVNAQTTWTMYVGTANRANCDYWSGHPTAGGCVYSVTAQSKTVVQGPPAIPGTITVIPSVPGGNCTLSPGGGGFGPNTVYPNPGGTTYILTCTTMPPTCTSATITNSQGGGSAMVVFPASSEGFTVTYNCIGIPPTVDLQADAGSGFADGPLTISSGQSITLQWAVTGPSTSCTASNNGGNAGWAGPKSASGGTQSSGPITTSTRFSMQCENGGTPSLIDDVEVIVNGVPNPPPVLSATPGACSTGSISLGWSASLGATSYSLTRDGVQIYAGPAVSHVDTGLVAGSSHTYRAYGVNIAGNSPVSNIVIENAPVVCPVGSATLNVTSNQPAATWNLDNGGGSGTGTQTVTVTPAPGGTTYTLTPQTLPGFNVSVVPPSVTVVGGSVDSFTINYSPSGGPFSYTLSANNITVTQGQTGQTIAAITGASAAETVGLSIGSLPAGVSVTFANSPCTPNCNAFINFTVSNSVAPGTYPITVNGLSSGTSVARSDTLTLTVLPSSTLTVSCTAVPNPAEVGQLVTWTASVAGNTNPVTYLWSGDNVPPAITSPSFSLRYLTTGPKNASVQVTEAVTGATASCPSVYIPVNVKPVYKEF